MSGYLLYHPRRARIQLGDTVVYHDPMRKHNQDPYIWSERFLHSYCHITQLSPRVGDVLVWVSGDTFPHFTQLWCDLVFVVAEQAFWLEANHIQPNDPLVESATAFDDHYRWAMTQHQLRRRRRYTLKADAARSFQPQDGRGGLIDVVPLLHAVGYTLDELHRGMRAGFQSKPMRLGDRAAPLYQLIAAAAPVQLRGPELARLRPLWQPQRG